MKENKNILSELEESKKSASRLEQYFTKVLASGKSSLYIPYLSLGDPSMKDSVQIAEAMFASGADILELGIPFSDPVADGPVIQKAFARALSDETFDIEKYLNLTGRIHELQADKPLLYLIYFNLIYQYGLDAFLKRCKEIGIQGLVIPDLPYDSPEGLYMAKAGIEYNVDLIYLITPGTDTKRLKEMGKISRGFIYYVSSFGVTGSAGHFSDDLEQRVAMVKKVMNNKVAVGFGIDKAEHAEYISSFADGVIVGSANHKIIEANISNPETIIKDIGIYTSRMAEASHS